MTGDEAHAMITDEMVIQALHEYISGDHDTPEQAMRAALTAALAKALRPVSEAKKDGAPVLIKFRDDLPARVSGFAGKCAVVRWAFDGGEWSYHGPIGMGGFPDEWIAGWMPLPAPPPQQEGE